MTDAPRNETRGLWGYSDVAEYLGIKEETVRLWAARRRLPVVKVGKLNRFRPEDIEAWVAANTLPTEGDAVTIPCDSDDPDERIYRASKADAAKQAKADRRAS